MEPNRQVNTTNHSKCNTLLYCCIPKPNQQSFETNACEGVQRDPRIKHQFNTNFSFLVKMAAHESPLWKQNAIIHSIWVDLLSGCHDHENAISFFCHNPLPNPTTQAVKTEIAYQGLKGKHLKSMSRPHSDSKFNNDLLFGWKWLDSGMVYEQTKLT